MRFSAKLKIFFRCIFYNLRKKIIPDIDHIARHLSPLHVDDDVVLQTGFKFKRDNDTGKLKEKELSVNWLEFINKNSSIIENVGKVREGFLKKGYTLKQNGRFAVLNIKKMHDEVIESTKDLNELVSLITKHTPKCDDMSHSSIFGMPFDSEGELLVSTTLANYANETDLYPAKILSFKTLRLI